MFLGREEELRQLNALRGKKSPSLIVLTGRRRIGKSRLVAEFGRNFPRFLEFSGLPPGPGVRAKEQRDEFQRQLRAQLGCPKIVTTDWGALLHHLHAYAPQGELLILLDELSWIANDDALFLAKLKTAWDLYFSRREGLILVLCSSVSSWVEDNLLTSTGFVGRLSLHLRLRELSLNRCAEFWKDKGSRVTNWEKVKLLAITGGVPRYLEEISPEESAEQNISRLCFREGAFLFEEFDRLFSELFNRHAHGLRQIASLLVDGDLSYEQIARELPQLDGGTLSRRLDTMLACGFISRDFTWHLSRGNPSKLSKFRISDNYVRFYLKYVEPYKSRIAAGTFPDRAVTALPGWDGIMGLQFENLVLANRRRVLELLGISLADVVSDNPYFQSSTKQRSGCQIDYLVQSRFHTLYVCEVKFSRNPIGKEAIEQAARAINALKRPKNFSVRPILICAGETTQELRDSRFFDKIIDLEQLFALN